MMSSTTSSTIASSSTVTTTNKESHLDFILPAGTIFYEFDKDFKLCRPHLMPLKSITLEKLEKMQKDAHKQLQETRARTAAAKP